jgi:hypothetical protein
MAVPEDIRKVERPRGTVVGDGHDGVYPVREKLSSRSWVDDEGKRHRPSRNGKVVGHIIDGMFVPSSKKAETVSVCDVDIKDWGEYCLCESLNRDLLEELKAAYAGEDAVRLYVMAMLRALRRGLTDRLMMRTYQESFISEIYTDLNLNKNQVSAFLRNVGRAYNRTVAFMRNRVSSCRADDRLIIDGSIKQDHSKINSLSAVSRKTCHTKHRDMSILYCYGMRSREPLCCKAYPGNMIDMRAVSDFIAENRITEGILIADKGFPIESVENEIRKHEGLHFLLPLKRDRPEIRKYSMLAFDSCLPDARGISCKKTGAIWKHRKVWLYSFRDPQIAKDEEVLYLNGRDPAEVDSRELASRRREFGTLAFISDLNLGCEEVDEIYSERWQIELMFRFERDILEMDDTREHSDYTAIASEFVDYLAAIMTARICRYLTSKKLLEKCTYGDAMHRLGRFKMVRSADDGTWRMNRTAITDAEFASDVGILVKPTVPHEVKKRGRPKGSRDTHPRRKRSVASTE